jgi:RNA polymerase sigma factor for flagellar operon FliA
LSFAPPSSPNFSALAPYGLAAVHASGGGADATAGGGEELLWRRWRDEGDLQAREELAQRYVAYARALAAKCYSRRVHNEFEFDEYFHFAVVGMMEALERYEPGRGALFKTFCTPRINGAILNGLDGLSERQQQIGLQQRLARERLESLKADAQQDPGQKLLQELGDIGVAVALGFLLEGTGMLVASDQTLPDNAYAQIELRQTRERLWQMVEALTEREAQVIRRHYLQQQAFEEIAVALKLTRGRVSQLHKQGLERLRKLLAAANFDVAC